MKPKIIVLGDNHHNTLGVIRSLGEKGLNAELIIKRTSDYFITVSKYLSSVYEISSESDLLKCLNNIAEKESIPSVLICCSDWFISVVDKNYDKLKPHFSSFNAIKPNEINRIMSKAVQQNYANAAGLTVPKTWTLTKEDQIPSDIVFPCIVKTEISVQGTKSDIVVCHDIKELEQSLIKPVPYIVQEYIEKEYELNALGCSINHGDTCIIPGIIHKIREYPEGKGSSSFSVLKDFNDYPGLDVNNICKLIKLLGYEGLFSVEFVYKNQQYYFLEVNLRNDGNGYIPTSAGVNLPYMWYCYSIGEIFDIPKASLPHYFMADVRDIFHVIKGKSLLFKTWLKDLRRTNCYLLYNKKDPKPFWKYIRNTVLASLGNRLRKITVKGD